jgi:hypothetical protein
MKTFKFHSDSGHGWLAVKLNLLTELNIVDKISQYSYLRGQTVYLEEDCDARVFHEAYTAKYGEYEVETFYYDRRSPIRSYTSFTGDVVKRILNSKNRLPFQSKE